MKKFLFAAYASAISLLSFSQCTDLFFSEYIEGTSFNKAIEIYNPTNTPIDLSDYMIRTYYNGNITASTLTLSGILNPGEVYIAAHPSAAAAILSVADVTNSGVINFNGNDAVELFKISTNTVIDIIGIVGNNPGTEWLLNGVSGTADRTLVRINTIKTGTNTWTGVGEMQWNIHPVNTFTYINTHAMKPCLSITPSSTIVCANTSIQFSANISGGQAPYTINWSFGDSGTGTGTPVNHTYTAAGTYIVMLVVTDALGEFETHSLAVTVNENPIVSIASIPDPASGCEPFNVCFTANVTNGQAPYTAFWDFDNSFNSTNLINACTNYAAGTYNPVVTVLDANGCSATASTTVNVFPKDSAVFNYSSTDYCINDPNPVPNISGTPGGTFTCNTCVVNAVTGEVNLLASGAGTHTLTYTTSGTCPDSSQQTLTIYTIANTNINPAGPFCEMGVPYQLTAATPGGVWSGNGIIDSNLGIFDASAAGAGTHTITYTISGSCSNSSNINIDVYANAAVNIHTSDTSVCNNVFGFNLMADAGGIWSGTQVTDMNNGQGFFNTTSIPAGTYWAVYTIPGLCGDTDSIQVNVSEYPIASFTYSQTGNIINFTSTSSTYGNTQALSYQWSYSNDGGSTWNNFSTLQNPLFTATHGTYIFCLAVTTGSVCGIETACTTVVINNVISSDILTLQIYPNPSNGIIYIENINTHHLQGVIYDLSGKAIFTSSTNTNKWQIDISYLPEGVYYLNLTGDEVNITQKIILLK
jgi:PKD repeat protein